MVVRPTVVCRYVIGTALARVGLLRQRERQTEAEKQMKFFDV